MRVRFWTQCYGCRHGGPNWHHSYRRNGHRCDWHYAISLEGVRLLTSGPFKTFERATHSARRAWSKLEATLDQAFCGMAS